MPPPALIIVRAHYTLPSAVATSAGYRETTQRRETVRIVGEFGANFGGFTRSDRLDSACYLWGMAQAPTDYELYLRVPELLSLQKPAAERSCPDELMFQVVHQAAELWMKLLDHELQQFIAYLNGAAEQLAAALTALQRVHHIQRILLSGLEMLYSLSPSDYMRIRATLGRGSGQESPGFRRMLALGGEVWPHFERLLDQSGMPLIELYREPRRHPLLFALAEGLLDFDVRLQDWRNRHILLVYRTIGVGTPSLKGKHSELLEKGLRTQFFPALWTVRDEIFGQWTSSHPHGAEQTYSGAPVVPPSPVVVAPGESGPAPRKRPTR